MLKCQYRLWSLSPTADSYLSVIILYLVCMLVLFITCVFLHHISRAWWFLHICHYLISCVHAGSCYYLSFIFSYLTCIFFPIITHLFFVAERVIIASEHYKDNLYERIRSGSLERYHFVSCLFLICVFVPGLFIHILAMIV